MTAKTAMLIGVIIYRPGFIPFTYALISRQRHIVESYVYAQPHYDELFLYCNSSFMLIPNYFRRGEREGFVTLRARYISWSEKYKSPVLTGPYLSDGGCLSPVINDQQSQRGYSN